jgi:TfoX/Sxy family transcriptional regulator of competence genes
MSSDLDFVEYVVGQISDECGISFKKMFGEYALYSNAKVVALVCDNQLFVKPTDAGKEYIGEYVEASAYPGAKPSLFIGDELEDSEWLSKLIIVTEKGLPKPKPKRKSKKVA